MDNILSTNLQPIPQHMSYKNEAILLLVGLSLFIIGFVSGYLVFNDTNSVVQAPHQTANITPTAKTDVLPTSTSSPNNQTNWRDFENQYFRLQFPNTWRFLNELNKRNNEIALFHLIQSESENDGTPVGNSYDIHVLSNAKGQDAMTFSKSDVIANWQQDNGPIYEAYPISNIDAVVVKNINAGKGAWGPAVYIVNKKFAVQIISESPLDNPNKYFYPVVNSFSFVTPNK